MAEAPLSNGLGILSPHGDDDVKVVMVLKIALMMVLMRMLIMIDEYITAALR